MLLHQPPQLRRAIGAGGVRRKRVDDRRPKPAGAPLDELGHRGAADDRGDQQPDRNCLYDHERRCEWKKR